MPKATMHVAYYFFLLTFWIDEGDGRWKKTEREILQRDIKLYKKIAARVEHELQEFYDDYADDDEQRLNVARDYYQSDRIVPKSSMKEESRNGQIQNEEPFLSKETKISNDIPIHNTVTVNESISSNKLVKNNPFEKVKGPAEKWPKFEDILLAIGKKYDWKNDRWIKIKEKFKNKESDLRKTENSIMFHEKHRFSYRSVKLNRGKNKRNVVIAVTAIR